MPSRTRALLDALAARFTGDECQAIEADIRKTKARLREAPAQRSSGAPAAAPKRR
jgi:hypothetical protein